VGFGAHAVTEDWFEEEMYTSLTMFSEPVRLAPTDGELGGWVSRLTKVVPFCLEWLW